jgi:hypothetical protein
MCMYVLCMCYVCVYQGDLGSGRPGSSSSLNLYQGIRGLLGLLEGCGLWGCGVIRIVCVGRKSHGGEELGGDKCKCK